MIAPQTCKRKKFSGHFGTRKESLLTRHLSTHFWLPVPGTRERQASSFPGIARAKVLCPIKFDSCDQAEV